MEDLDILFNKSESFKEIEEMRLPVSLKMGWILMLSLTLGGGILFVLSFVAGDVLNADDSFITDDENEQVLVSQMQKYCRPSLAQMLVVGKDKGTCRQKMNDMAAYMIARKNGDELPVNEDLVASMGVNAERLKERIKKNKLALGN